MAGWSHQKRVAVEEAFYEFLDHCFVNSKDVVGPCCLGTSLYPGQRYVITEIFDALEADQHEIYILKSRQLGITTIIRALTVFLIGIFRGIKGALVFDTIEHKNEARAELEVMIEDLPGNVKFPKVKSTNRDGLTLANNSKILFQSAGIKQSKGSGTLGRSVGLSMAHMSELCSYDNPEGLESFEQSLSDINPDRLYIKESTARGFNAWRDMWKAACNNPHCRCIFLGWWSKDTQQIRRDDPDFERYGVFLPSEKELAKIAEVKKLYDISITPEQLAWIRRKMDPSAEREGDATPEFAGNTTRIQEQPWVEDDSFQQTGAVFFTSDKLTDMSHNYASKPKAMWLYTPGVEFQDMRVLRARHVKETELRVWEEPDPEGVYVLAADPAFGENENNDRSAIQVLRCYADGLDQVAEYAYPLVNTRQFAWVIASLLGYYGSDKAEIRYILELNGPGTAVFNELRSLRQQLDNNYLPRDVAESGLKDVFRNVRTYIYSRPDSMGSGFNYHFKTTTMLKVMLMERLRDFVFNGMLHIRSFDLIDEMKTIAREGDTIKAPGSKKDDRVLAMAFAVHCWETKCRPALMSSKRTREADAARKRLSISDQAQLFSQNMLSTFFQQKKTERVNAYRQQLRQNWRSR